MADLKKKCLRIASSMSVSKQIEDLTRRVKNLETLVQHKSSLSAEDAARYVSINAFNPTPTAPVWSLSGMFSESAAEWEHMFEPLIQNDEDEEENPGVVYALEVQRSQPFYLFREGDNGYDEVSNNRYNITLRDGLGTPIVLDDVLDSPYVQWEHYKNIPGGNGEMGWVPISDPRTQSFEKPGYYTLYDHLGQAFRVTYRIATLWGNAPPASYQTFQPPAFQRLSNPHPNPQGFYLYEGTEVRPWQVVVTVVDDAGAAADAAADAAAAG